jgi:putative oxidoreductase
MICQRIWAGLLGAGFLVVGVLRFIRIPNIVDLSVSQPIHGIIHLTTGAALCWSAFRKRGEYAERVNLWTGLFFVALGVLGLPGVVKYADNSLHLFVGTASAALGGASPWSKKWQELSSRFHNSAIWILSALLAATFVAAGLPKLLGNARMVEEFQQIGLGQWLRYVTGAIEVGSSAGLLIPRVRPLASGILALTMIGASLANVETLHRSAILPAMLLVMTLVLLGWSADGNIKRTSRRFSGSLSS